METDEFNATMRTLTEDFIDNWTRIVDKYAEENELGPNHKLTCFLYSHLGIERALSDRVWKVGAKYIDAVVEIGKEIKKNEV